MVHNVWISIDGASVKRSLLRNGLKLNFHRYIGQLRRPLPRLQKTAWRRFIVHMCRACMDDDYVHAKRNDKAVCCTAVVERTERRRRELLVRNKDPSQTVR